jgi:MFS family permease
MAPTAGVWGHRFGPQWATVLGLGFGALALVVTPLLVRPPVVFIPPALIGIAIGLSLPLLISIVTTAAPDDQRGVALGLRGTVNQAAGTAAPLAVGPLMSALGLGLGFVAGGGIGFVLLFTAVALHRRSGEPGVRIAPLAPDRASQHNGGPHPDDTSSARR